MIWDEEKLEAFFEREQMLIDRINSVIKGEKHEYTSGGAHVVLCYIINKMLGFREVYPMMVMDIKKINKCYELMEKKDGRLQKKV